MGADDALDIFAIHAIGGFVGEVLTWIFAADYIAHLDGTTVIKGGWLNGNWVQIAIQLADGAASMVWSIIVMAFSPANDFWKLKARVLESLAHGVLG